MLHYALFAKDQSNLTSASETEIQFTIQFLDMVGSFKIGMDHVPSEQCYK